MTYMLCTFLVDGQPYAVPAERVQEVLRHQRVTPVPLAEFQIAGLINLRGSVVCGINLRARIGAPTAVTELAVVVRHEGGAVALLVDDIEDVTAVDEETLEPPPSTIPELIRGMLVGVHEHAGRLLCVLDVDLIAAGS